MIDPEDFAKVLPELRFEGLTRSKAQAAIQERRRKIAERTDRLFQKYITARKNLDLKTMSLDALIGRFEEICLVRDQIKTYFEEEDVKRCHQCQSALWAVHLELKRRGPDARRALVRLYGHDNPQVRLKAAILSYPVAPEEARRCLEAIASFTSLRQAGEAGSTLREIDDGTSGLG
jgi:hypothetical protein